LVLQCLDQPFQAVPQGWRPQLEIILDVRARTLRVIDNGHGLALPAIKEWGKLGASKNKNELERLRAERGETDANFLKGHFACMFSSFGVGEKGAHVLEKHHACCG
jgi:HSP90 family molecular chaperone